MNKLYCVETLKQHLKTSAGKIKLRNKYFFQSTTKSVAKWSMKTK